MTHCIHNTSGALGDDFGWHQCNTLQLNLRIGLLKWFLDQTYLWLVPIDQKAHSWSLLPCASGNTAPDVLAVPVTSTPATGCVGSEAAPSTWPASPARPANGSCPPGRNVDFWRTGSSVGLIMKWWWKISNVPRKMVSLLNYDLFKILSLQLKGTCTYLWSELTNLW